MIHKCDLYGRPICYTIVKNIHPERYTDEQLWAYTTWYTYRLLAAFPKNIDNYIVIYDFKGAGLSNINYHQLKNVIAGVGGVFPEMMFWIFVVRAAWFVNMAYAAVKPVMYKET